MILRKLQIIFRKVFNMPRKETVKRVIDGDTFVTGSRKNPVRLANEIQIRKK